MIPTIQQTGGKSITTWEEDFKNHPVHTTVQNVKEKLDSYSAGEDSSAISLLSRFIQIINYIDMCLENTNPALVPKAPLDQINAQVSATVGQLDNYTSNKNQGHLTNANNHAEAAAAQCIHLPQPSHKTNKSFSKIVSDSYETSKRFISEITAVKNTFETDLANVNKHSEKLEEKIKKQEQTIEDHKTRLDTILSEFQSQFSEMEAKRSQKFSDKADKQTETFNSLLDKFSLENKGLQDEIIDKLTTQIDESRLSAKSAIKFLEEKKQEALDLVGVIGNICVTGNFKNIANDEQKIANRYRRIAIVAILYIPVQYASKESDRHRKNERKNRRLELELASIDPFLENLPLEKRNNLKETLAQRYFAQPDQDTPSDSIPPNALLDLLKSAVDSLAKK